MKTVINILIFLFLISCKAQTVTPLYPGEVYVPSGMHPFRYHKDIDNDYNAYVGTWKWEDGNSSLTMTFNKVVHFSDGYGGFWDYLVGEYKYVVNGTILVDSYPELLMNGPNGVPNIVNSEHPLDNNISSIGITTLNERLPACSECSPNTRFIKLNIFDPTKPGLWGEIRMAHFVESGVEKIRLRIYNTYIENFVQGYSGPTGISIPENSIWTLTKVN